MKLFYPFLIVFLFIFCSCKKDKIQNADDNKSGGTTVAVIPLPDSALFLGGQISDSSVIYVLNASTGALVKKYGYKRTPLVSCVPYAGNGYLYAGEGTNIRALNPTTGVVQWIDSLNTGSYNLPVLHDNMFSGVCTGQSSGSFAYGLDATKQSDKFLWQYPLSSYKGYSFYNGVMYIITSTGLTALDATTGTLKWSLTGSYDLSALNSGVIISDKTILDATSGTFIGTIPVSPIYATKSLYFTRTVTPTPGSDLHATTSVINAYDVITSLLNWKVNGGNYNYLRDTTNAVDQVFNNQVIVRSRIEGSAGINGPYYSYAFFGYDLNTGQFKWQYNAGLAGPYFNAYNVRYSTGSINTHTVLRFPQSPSLVAADLNTGKIKWSHGVNDILCNYGTDVSFCLFTGGKGYAAYIYNR